jgi:hypothetical protein
MISGNGSRDCDDITNSTGGRFSQWVIPLSVEVQEVVGQ